MSTLTNWHPHPLTRNYADNGWGCDGRSRDDGGCRRGITGFNQTTGVPRYRCDPCDFDLCDLCFEAATRQPETKKETKKEEEEEEDTGPHLPLYLAEVFGQLYNSETLSDVRFLVEDKKIPAHRLLLATASPLFEEMLYRKGTDGGFDSSLPEYPIEVKITGVTADDFLSLLKCIYTDEVEITASNIQGLIKVASKYQVEKLKLSCAEFMEGDVTKENVLDLFQIAPAMLGDEEFGLKFIELNTEEVLASDNLLRLSRDRLSKILSSDKLTIEEIELFKHLVRWGQAELKRTQGEGVTLKSVVGDLIKFIRFPVMPINAIAATVAPSGLLEQKDLVGLFSFVSVTDENIRKLLPNPGFPTVEREGSNPGFTWDIKRKGRSVTFSNNNLTATTSGSSWNGGVVLGSKEFKSGDHYWEVKIDNSQNDMIGVASPSINPETNSAYSSCSSQVWFYHLSGGLYGGTVGVKDTSFSMTATTGDTLGFLLEWNKTSSTYSLSLYKNKFKIGTPFRNIPPPVVPAVELYCSPARVTLDSKAKKP